MIFDYLAPDSSTRIIVYIHYMELGGVVMALLKLLNVLNPNNVDLDLFIYRHHGPLMRFFPKWGNLLHHKSLTDRLYVA